MALAAVVESRLGTADAEGAAVSDFVSVPMFGTFTATAGITFVVALDAAVFWLGVLLHAAIDAAKPSTTNCLTQRFKYKFILFQAPDSYFKSQSDFSTLVVPQKFQHRYSISDWHGVLRCVSRSGTQRAKTD